MNNIKINEIILNLKPSKLIEIQGNNDIIKFLNKCIELNDIPNAIIVHGDLSTGKTILANLFAKSSNCISKDIINRPCNDCSGCSGKDIFEYNASNYTLIENTRELIESIHFKPYLSKYKFYILDEFHMMSTKSFNALLKEIDNIPEFSKVIFVSNNIDMIPDTLISRCFLIKLEPLSKVEIRLFIENKLSKLKLNIEKSKLDEIINISSSMREIINLIASVIITGMAPINNSDIYPIINDILKKFKFLNRDNLQTEIKIIVDIVKKNNSKKILVELFDFIYMDDSIVVKNKLKMLDIIIEGYKDGLLISRAYTLCIIKLCYLFADIND